MKKEEFFNQTFNLQDKIAVVTGGMGILGAEYTKALSFAGAKVAIYDIIGEPTPSLEELAQSFPIKFFKVDLTQKDQVEKATEDLQSLWGVPHILINNAGLDVPPDREDLASCTFEKYPLGAFQQIFNSHVVGAINCCQVIGGKMAQIKMGSIINISSHYGINPPDQEIYQYKIEDGHLPFFKPLAYGLAKAGMVYLTKYLASYWKGKVRVNTLIPGGAYKDHDPRFVRDYSKRTLIGRMAEKDEYNGAILFLGSDASSYMTGEMLIMDGGWTVK